MPDLRTRRRRAPLERGGSLTVTSFTQSVGPELVTNGSFANWTADNPDNFTVLGEVGSDPACHQVAPNEGHLGVGTGAANLFSTVTANAPNINSTSVVLPAGSVAILEAICSNWVSGQINIDCGSNGFANVFGSAETQRSIDYTSIANALRIIGSSAAKDATLDSVSLKQVTLNAQQAVPANSISDLFYALPASPLTRMAAEIRFRIQDPANFLRVRVLRFNANYNISLDKVVNYAPTVLASASGIGAHNGIRADYSGSSLKMWTTANDGVSWTQRGSTATDAAFALATGLNTLYNVEFTPNRLVSVPQ